MAKVNRRQVLQLASAGAVVAGTARAAPSPAATPRWGIFEVTLKGPKAGNPFRDVQVSAVFSQGTRSVTVNGFYDGDGVYKVRFMPDTVGAWRYKTASNVSALDGRTGRMSCTNAEAGVHGPVGVCNTHHFGYADGTAYFPFGTTCYAWIHQSQVLQKQTLESLAKSGFNKIRMCVFPKHYEYNHNEPELYPFVRDSSGKSDFSRPDPAFYRHLEDRIADLGKLGIEADLILFHPYDRWGYATMEAQDDDAYVRYVVARLSAHRNVWWSMANEYDLMKAKTTADFDRLFHIVEKADPVPHLRSIHHSGKMYDYAQPWVSHASIQVVPDLLHPSEQTAGYFKQWNKPVVYDEVQYEGNLNKRWGNISGDELTFRSWRAVLSGAYVTHGETMLRADDALSEDSTPVLWWAHGGELRGQSPARIAFLRRLVEETLKTGNGQVVRAGLEPAPAPYYQNATATMEDGKTASTILYFLDFHQPVWYEFPLPDGNYQADMIDILQMTITPLSGTVSGKAKLKLDSRPYQAVRFRRV